MNVSTPDWVKDAVFYQIFPDRFAQSSRVSKQSLHLEAWESPPTIYGFKGGDLLGVVDHLDYLQDLGINAIYFNPIFASASNHRYHTNDYFNVDPLLGGNAAFKELLMVAHERGIRIILDGVFNHASRGFWQFHHVLENGEGSPFVDWFYFRQDRLQHLEHWGAYPDAEEQRALNRGVSSYDALGYRAWWNLPALPKFNTETPAVREFIWNVGEYWINQGVDGWRLDVPGEINDDPFWMEFRRRIKRANPEAYIVGEIWHEANRWLQGDQFDAVMNYQLTGAIMSYLIGTRLEGDILQIGGFGNYVHPVNAVGFADRIDYLFSLYHPQVNQVQLNLLDSHDTPRFLTTARNDQSALRLGWLFLLTIPGAPCIYYGDEIGMDGGRDPACRKSFQWDKTTWNKDLLAYLKELIALRKAHPALRLGAFQRIYAVDWIYVYCRELEGETIVTLINGGTQAQRMNQPVDSLALNNRKLEVIFGNNKGKVIDGQLQGLELAPRSGMVLRAVT